MAAEYRNLLSQQQHGQNQTPGQSGQSGQGSGQQQPLFQFQEQVRASLADCLGTSAEAARSAAIDRNIAHQIVEQAYQKTW